MKPVSKSMNPKKNHILTRSLQGILLLILTQSCDYFGGKREADKTVELYYELLESSIEHMPYTHHSEVVFVDSSGHLLNFSIHAEKIYSYSPVIPVTKENELTGEIIDYQLTHELKNFFLISDSLGLEFQILLEAEPSEIDLDIGGTVRDRLTISVKTEGEDYKPGGKHSRSSVEIFECIVDERNWGNGPRVLVNEFDSLTIMNSTFSNVFEMANSGNSVYQMIFNFEYGVLSFRDSSGTQWRFEKFVD